jgi:DNA replication protein DnaC
MNALVVEALKRDYTALQRPAFRILLDLQAARADGSYRQRFRRLCTVDLLALDDFGLRPLPRRWPRIPTSWSVSATIARP